MPRPATLRCLAVVAALAPVWAALSVVAAPPAFGVAPATRSATLAALAQFNDDCSRAHPPDECQPTGDDDCNRAHPPDECSRPGEVVAFKFCDIFTEAGRVCVVLIANISDVEVTNVVVRDVLAPRDVRFGEVFQLRDQSLEPVFTPCPFGGHTARCHVGTLQPGETVLVAAALRCPPRVEGGTNTASINSKNAPPVTASAPFSCRPDTE